MSGRPKLWTKPNPREITTPSARTSEGQRSRRRPRRATNDFQGASSTIATPAAAWMTRVARAGWPPSSNATHPLAKATAKRLSSARLVTRPPPRISSKVVANGQSNT